MFLAKKDNISRVRLQNTAILYNVLFLFRGSFDYTGAKRQSSAIKPQELNHLDQQRVESVTLYFENTPY